MLVFQGSSHASFQNDVKIIATTSTKSSEHTKISLHGKEVQTEVVCLAMSQNHVNLQRQSRKVQ